jgi:hypothetical protein
MATAPDCDTSATLPGRADVRANVAFRPSDGRIRPRQFGPISRTPWRRATSSISSCSFFPAGPISAKPADSTSILGTPRAPASSTSPGTVRAGVTTTARSGTYDRSRNVATHGRPCTEVYFGFTASIRPLKPPASRLAKTSRPSVAGRSLAPITATDAGASADRR